MTRKILILSAKMSGIKSEYRKNKGPVKVDLNRLFHLIALRSQRNLIEICYSPL